MPRTKAQSKVMQPTGNFHHHVPNIVLPVAEFVLDDATAFHTPTSMLNPHFLAGNALIFCFLLRGQFPTARLLRRLLDQHGRDRKALEPHVLIEHRVRG